MNGDQDRQKTPETLLEQPSATSDQSDSQQLENSPASSSVQESPIEESPSIKEGPNWALVRKWFAEFEEEERLAKESQGHPLEDEEEDEEELTPNQRAMREYEARMKARGIKPGYLD